MNKKEPKKKVRVIGTALIVGVFFGIMGLHLTKDFIGFIVGFILGSFLFLEISTEKSKIGVSNKE